MTSVIGTTDLGAFHITSDLLADELVTILDSHVETPTQLLSLDNEVPPGTAVVDTAASGAPITGCGDLGIGIEIKR